MTWTGTWPLKVFILLGVSTRLSHCMLMKGWSCWVPVTLAAAERVPENGVCFPRLWPGRRAVRSWQRQGLISQNWGQWVERKWSGSLDTLGETREIALSSSSGGKNRRPRVKASDVCLPIHSLISEQGALRTFRVFNLPILTHKSKHCRNGDVIWG